MADGEKVRARLPCIQCGCSRGVHHAMCNPSWAWLPKQKCSPGGVPMLFCTLAVLSLWFKTVFASALSAWPQADYYFIPMSQRGPTDSVLLQEAVQYIRQHWPWWDRHQGHKHLIFQTGGCQERAAHASLVPKLLGRGLGCICVQSQVAQISQQ